ncbi:MAG: glycosyltransferase family 9 protein [Thermoanaerobaculia bacterium]|nr:glycosyltransferase family 9 protein [Thermoanaerobaculia bacterium]
MNRTETPPLVVRFGALGDMIMLTPALQAIFDRYKQPVDVVTSGGWSRNLYDGLEFVGRVRVLKSRKTPYIFDSTQRKIVRELRARGPGPCWVMEMLSKVYWLIERGGIPDSMIVKQTELAPKPDEHDVEQMLRLARIDPPDATPPAEDRGRAYMPRLHVSDAELEECAAWCRTVGVDPDRAVVVQPGNKRTMHGGWRRRPSNVKYWPEERWAEVIDRILDTDDRLRVIINTTPSERPLVEDIRRQLSRDSMKRTVAGESSLRRLIAMISLAHSCISVDTGPAHIAGAVGCPVVVLFGETSPRSYRPWAEPGRARIVSRHPEAVEGSIDEAGLSWRQGSRMDAIDPDLVIRAWKQLPEGDRTEV